MKPEIENLVVREDGNKRGFYVVDVTSRGHKYLNKDGKLQEGVSRNDCWWPTRKAAMDFVLDMESDRNTERKTIELLEKYRGQINEARDCLDCSPLDYPFRVIDNLKKILSENH